MNLICPKCRSGHVKCVKCGALYLCGEASHCPREACQAMNSPLDCLCGSIATSDLKGVQPYSHKTLKFILQE